MMTCSDLMTTNPVWCLASDVVSSAAQLMKHEEVGLIPVLDEQQHKKLIGVVTDRDLVLNVLAEGRRADATPVGEVMTTAPVTCRANDPFENALSAMAQHQIRRVPVVNEDGAIVGIIAQADVVLRVNDPTTTSEIVRKISKPTPIHPSMAIAK